MWHRTRPAARNLASLKTFPRAVFLTRFSRRKRLGLPARQHRLRPLRRNRRCLLQRLEVLRNRPSRHHFPNVTSLGTSQLKGLLVSVLGTAEIIRVAGSPWGKGKSRLTRPVCNNAPIEPPFNSRKRPHHQTPECDRMKNPVAGQRDVQSAADSPPHLLPRKLPCTIRSITMAHSRMARPASSPCPLAAYCSDCSTTEPNPWAPIRLAMTTIDRHIRMV